VEMVLWVRYWQCGLRKALRPLLQPCVHCCSPEWQAADAGGDGAVSEVLAMWS
jgi:hypothetical protein